MSAIGTRYGYSLVDWDNAKEEMRSILIELARVGETIPFSELVRLVQAIKLQPRSPALAGMLGEICSEEDAARRGMLSAVVVHKRGDKLPGKGFFNLAKNLGRDTSDTRKCWEDESKRVHSYWSSVSLGSVQKPLVVSDPSVMMGKPVIAGTRITVELILEKMAAGETIQQILDEHPRLTEEAIRAALAFASEALRADVVYPVGGKAN